MVLTKGIHLLLLNISMTYTPSIRLTSSMEGIGLTSSMEGIGIDGKDSYLDLDQATIKERRLQLRSTFADQELVGLISDEKLVNLLDLALSADIVNTVKNLRVIMETGVEPLALMSQLATVITNIFAGSYDFTKDGHKRMFFRRKPLSKEDMEKVRQSLKTLSGAEKQLRMSNDKLTWLTAALLQLAPDQQYLLPISSADT